MNPPLPHISSEVARRQAIDMLNDGGVIVLPTDTLYGFSTCLVNRAGVERIALIKQAPADQKFLVLADAMSMVESYVAGLSPDVRALLDNAWPAPLTAILPASPTCPDWIDDTIALRVPALAPLRQLISALGQPIVSTSVNVTGEAPLRGLAEIERRFGDQVDMLVAGDEQEGEGLASTIVDFTGARPSLVRMGSYLWADEEAGDSNPSK